MMYKIIRVDALQHLKDILLEMHGERHYILLNHINIQIDSVQSRTQRCALAVIQYGTDMTFPCNKGHSCGSVPRCVQRYPAFDSC